MNEIVKKGKNNNNNENVQLNSCLLEVGLYRQGYYVIKLLKNAIYGWSGAKVGELEQADEAKKKDVNFVL